MEKLVEKMEKFLLKECNSTISAIREAYEEEEKFTKSLSLHEQVMISLSGEPQNYEAWLSETAKANGFKRDF